MIRSGPPDERERWWVFLVPCLIGGAIVLAERGYPRWAVLLVASVAYLAYVAMVVLADWDDRDRKEDGDEQ